MDDADAAIAAEQQEVKNPFPTPPTYWTRYTPENLRLLALLKEKIAIDRNKDVPKESEDVRMSPNETPGDENKLDQGTPVDQAELLPDEHLLPSFPLLELEPPRLDWVLEQKYYSTFGEDRPTSEEPQSFPPGIQKLYNPEPGADPRPHLRQLLLSLLSAYHKLLSDILEPVPSGYHQPPPSHDPYAPPNTIDGMPDWPPPLNWEFTILWIRSIVLNLGWAVNEFRPVQARMTLESMMRRQIEIRREETKNINSKCNDLEKMLADLRKKVSSLVPTGPHSQTVQQEEEELAAKEVKSRDTNSATNDPAHLTLNFDDLLTWANESQPS